MNLVRKLVIGLTMGLSVLAFNVMADKAPQKTVTIGIVAPVQIPAMDQIIAGFEGELNHLYDNNNVRVVYVVQNAQGDMNIMRSIFLQFKNQKVDMVVPIGTSANQMALSIIKDQPIVTLAAAFTEADRAKSPNKNVTSISDEVAVSKQFAFIHQAMPNLKYLTLVYSPDDRIYAQVQQASADAKKYGITIQKLQIQQLSDLYTVSKRINTNSQAIFILKDEMVVSGVPTLVKVAQARNIPLIASDDGSVSSGAAFAVGVSERQIGSDGASLALQVLNGTPAINVPIKIMTDYNVFINTKAAETQNVDLGRVTSASNAFSYPVIYLNAV